MESIARVHLVGTRVSTHFLGPVTVGAPPVPNSLHFVKVRRRWGLEPPPKESPATNEPIEPTARAPGGAHEAPGQPPVLGRLLPEEQRGP